MVVTGAIIVTSIWVIMGGLKGLCGASEGQLGAMAIIVEKLRLSEIVHYFLDGLLGIGFVVQRRIAKRAIKEKSRQQHRAESLDLHRSSSGLTPTGETPND